MTNFVINKCGCRDALMPGKSLKLCFADHLLACKALIRSAAKDARFSAHRGSGTNNGITVLVYT